MGHLPNEDRTFLQALIGDGRLPLLALGFGLLMAGGTALYLAATGHFLPHDERFLGMAADDLCALHGCRVVHFMIHDRASFGGVLMAIGLFYLWLAEFPLRERQAWAWWAILVSGAVGFASFLAYIGYGYLDLWHGVATLALLPSYIVGLICARTYLKQHDVPSSVFNSPPRFRAGWICLMMASLGATGAGLVILAIGMTAVFVSEDLAYMGVSVEELNSLNPRLVPLIAHDRAGFGGALVSAGSAASLCIWFGRPSKALWQVLALAGLVGFGPAIGVHFAIGYTDVFHLSPAVAGAALYAAGLVFTYRPMHPDEART